jgi:SagB-type dehydrogenase family enzyme
LAGDVEGVKPGFYLLDLEERAICAVSGGPTTERMMHICLDQEWLRNCALHFLFLGNLELLERTWGARGYRRALMTAGNLGQRLYLAATAMQIGCCGIGAFYDDEACKLLGLNDQSWLYYLVAVGPLRKWTEGRR